MAANTDDPHPEGMAMSQQLLRAMTAHCEATIKYIMLTDFFNLASIDISECFIDRNLNLSIRLYGGEYSEKITISARKIIERNYDTAPWMIRLSAGGGLGKTTTAKHLVYTLSKEFLQHVIVRDGEISFKGEPPKWTTAMFIKATDIKTTVEQAIRESLGCEANDLDTLMEHVQMGNGVLLVIDDAEEIKGTAADEKLKQYINDQKMTGKHVVLMLRTNGIYVEPNVLTPCLVSYGKLSESYDSHMGNVHRDVTMSGFSADEGLAYVKLHFKAVCTSVVDAQALFDSVQQHKDIMTPLLMNPQSLYIFCGLAVRGIVDHGQITTMTLVNLYATLDSFLLSKNGTYQLQCGGNGQTLASCPEDADKALSQYTADNKDMDDVSFATTMLNIQFDCASKDERKEALQHDNIQCAQNGNTTQLKDLFTVMPEFAETSAGVGYIKNGIIELDELLDALRKCQDPYILPSGIKFITQRKRNGSNTISSRKSNKCKRRSDNIISGRFSKSYFFEFGYYMLHIGLELSSCVSYLLHLLLDHKEYVSQHGFILVDDGTAEAEALLTALRSCEEAGLNVSVRGTRIVSSNNLADAKMLLDRVKDKLDYPNNVHYDRFRWMKENGEYFDWPSQQRN